MRYDEWRERQDELFESFLGIDMQSADNHEITEMIHSQVVTLVAMVAHAGADTFQENLDNIIERMRNMAKTLQVSCTPVPIKARVN